MNVQSTARRTVLVGSAVAADCGVGAGFKQGDTTWTLLFP